MNNAWQQKEELLAAQQQQLPIRMTRRQHLAFRRQSLVSDLAAVDKAIAALDAHPELEEFIETLASVGV